MIGRLTCFFLALTVSAVAALPIESQSIITPNPTPIERNMQVFMLAVASDVTNNGPLAWAKYFDNGPAFFMVVNGQMAFPSGNAAKEGTEKFARTIRHIELNWGDDLRVDVLSQNLVVVAVPWREVQIDAGGHSVEEQGYFTALLEYRDARWRFRNAHWSSPVSPMK